MGRVGHGAGGREELGAMSEAMRGKKTRGEKLVHRRSKKGSKKEENSANEQKSISKRKNEIEGNPCYE